MRSREGGGMRRSRSLGWMRMWLVGFVQCRRMPAALAGVGSVVAALGCCGVAFAAAPTVSSVSPDNGPAAGGTSVTIAGTGFLSGASVKFGSTAATDATVKSGSSIAAKSPEGAGTVDVSVSDSGGTSATSAKDLFAYDPVLSGPWLGAVYNSSEWWDGGTNVFSSHGIVFDRRGWNRTSSGQGIEFEAGELPASGDDLERSVDAGMVPVVGIDYDGALEDGYGPDPNFPHTTAGIKAYAEGFVETASAIRKAYPGKQILFEVMYEPWGNTTPVDDGEEYGNVVAKVLPEARAAGIPLEDVYVPAIASSQNAKGEYLEGWIPAIYKADPSLEGEVRGWATEPYGPPTGISGDGNGGIELLPSLREQMRSGENNLIVSAIGFCAKNVAEGYGCNEEAETVDTGSEAAEDLTSVLNTALGYHEEGWLKALIVFVRSYGGWSLQLENGELTQQGEALDRFAEFHSAPQPQVSSINTNNGPTEGGTSVKITGSGFATNSTVKFGATPATEVVVNSWNSITAKSPEGAGTVDVTVSDSGGTSATSAKDLFAYDPVLEGPWLGAVFNSSESWDGGADVFPSHGVIYDRGGSNDTTSGQGIEFEAGEKPTSGDDLERSIDAGMIPVVTVAYDGSQGHGYGSDPKFPHTTAGMKAYAEGFVETASAIRKAYPGKQILFEVMYEPWGNTTPVDDGEEYGNVVAQVLPEARAAGIPSQDVYVDAIGSSQNAKGEYLEGWIPAMYKADPSLEGEVRGWATEPYGPPTGISGDGNGGIELLPVLREQMHSGENNLIVSAIGFCARNVAEGLGCAEEAATVDAGSEAAEDLTHVLNTALGYHEEGWLKALIVFVRSYGGYSLQLENGELTQRGEALDKFSEATRHPATGQPGWYALLEEADSESEQVSVNVAGGNLLVRSEDVASSEASAGVSLERYYNSKAPWSPSGGLGPRWSWGAGPDVSLAIFGEAVVLHGPSGYTVALHRQSDGSYTAPEEFEGTLTKNEDGTYTLSETEEGVTYQFNAHGTMTSYSNEEGEAFTVSDTTFSGKSLLGAISPASGKALEVSYGAGSKVSEVTGPEGAVRRYAYNWHGELASYTNPAGETTEYEYTRKGYLDKITTPSGTVETIAISNGRVTEVSTSSLGEATYGAKFSYQSPSAPCNPQTDAGQTIVTDTPTEESTEPEVYCYDALGQITRYPGTAGAENEDEEGAVAEQEAGAETPCTEETGVTIAECAAYEEEAEGAIRPAVTPGGRGEQLSAEDFGIAEDNRIEGTGTYDAFHKKAFTHLGIKYLRIFVPWNLVYEGEVNKNAAYTVELKELDEKLKQFGEDSTGGIVLVSLEHCEKPSEEVDKTVKEEESRGATVERNTYWYPPGVGKTGDPKSCDEVPTAPQYKEELKVYLENTKAMNHVKYFTAWNEPNNTHKQTKMEEKRDAPLLPETGKPEAKTAGEYWDALNHLCKAHQPQCEGVVAGDFSDYHMQDASKTNNYGGKYLAKYYAAMGQPKQAPAWAFHTYLEGAQVLEHPKTPGDWWNAFHAFLAGLDKKTKAEPKIWLTEQGVLYPSGKTIKEKTRKDRAYKQMAKTEMDAYVHDGQTQLTNQSKQIGTFFYYEMRGDGTFDSGLIEPETEETKRNIYYIYEKKTPKTG